MSSDSLDEWDDTSSSATTVPLAAEAPSANAAVETVLCCLLRHKNEKKNTMTRSIND